MQPGEANENDALHDQAATGQAGPGRQVGNLGAAPGIPHSLGLSFSSFPRSAMPFSSGGLRAHATALPGSPLPEGGAHRGTSGKHRAVHQRLQGEGGPRRGSPFTDPCP